MLLFCDYRLAAAPWRLRLSAAQGPPPRSVVWERGEELSLSAAAPGVQGQRQEPHWAGLAQDNKWPRQRLNPSVQVRAGARDGRQAELFLRNAISFGLLPKDAAKSVTVVQFDLEDPDSLPAAIGEASKVCNGQGRKSWRPAAAATQAALAGHHGHAHWSCGVACHDRLLPVTSAAAKVRAGT